MSNPVTTSNGEGLAALLAAGIGAFAMGAIVLLNEAGLLVLPALYAPAGGVSSRTTLAVVVWLFAWAVLHYQWRTRTVAPRPIFMATLALITLGVLGTFPPVWTLL